MNAWMKAGCLFLVAGVMLSAENARKTASDFFMESYSSQLKEHLASIAEYRADEYRSHYEKCGPHHDCFNITAAGQSKKTLSAQKAEEAREKFPFMGARMWQ